MYNVAKIGLGLRGWTINFRNPRPSTFSHLPASYPDTDIINHYRQWVC